jgi:hypothetical protein
MNPGHALAIAQSPNDSAAARNAMRRSLRETAISNVKQIEPQKCLRSAAAPVNRSRGTRCVA